MSDEKTAYPLNWPPNRLRTPPSARENSLFRRRRKVWSQVLQSETSAIERLTIENARQLLDEELRRLGAESKILSSNLRLRLDGNPISGQAEPTDPGVAVYFSLKGLKTCFCCDRWNRTADNIAAIAHTIEALRGIERWGSGEMVRAAFTGFRALPAMEKPWREVLGFQAAAVVSEEEIQRSFKEKARKVHPDVGGFDVLMSELNRARDSAIRELEGRA